MKMVNLTQKQQLVLDIILESVRNLGYPPSIRELVERSGIKSLRGVTLQLDALENAGLIYRKSRARGIVVAPFLLQKEEQMVDIPLMAARIPAGPMSDISDFSDERISVTLTQTKGLKNVFGIKVVGDSMVGLDINDGDIAIIFPQPVANDGEIVAARTEKGLTLKKYRIVEGRPMLFPANPKYAPITDSFEIQGKLINVIKT